MSKLPAGWAESTIGDTCAIVSGSTPKTSQSEYWGGDVPWITPDDLSRHLGKTISGGRRYLSSKGFASCSAQMVPAGTVLYTSRAPIGYAAIAARPVCTNQGFKSIIPPAGINCDYLYWYMRHATELIRSRASGTTFPEISGRAMATIPLLIPPAAEQERIVATIEEQFSRLDAGTGALERAKQNLQRMRISILQAAMTGKLVAQLHGEEPASASLARVSMSTRFHNTLSPLPTDLPTLPARWCWARVGHLVERVTVGHVGPTKGKYMTEGVPFVRSQNVRINRFDYAGLVKISPSFHQMLAKSVVVPGDVLIVRSGVNRGVACVAPAELGEANCADIVVAQRPTGINPHFLSYFINSVAQRYVHDEQVGVAIPHFNTQSVSALPISVPPLAEQARIVDEAHRQLTFIGKVEEAIAKAERQSERLRSSILSAAFSGKLVPQDPNDEPASVLLERIAAERAASNGHKPTRKARQERLPLLRGGEAGR